MKTIVKTAFGVVLALALVALPSILLIIAFLGGMK